MIRLGIFSAAVIIGLAVLSAGAQAGLKVDRVWADPDIDSGFALVAYTNDSKKTFGTVTIQCTALGPGGKKLNTDSRSFFSSEHGPIVPGFTGTLRVTVSLYNAKMEKMYCRAWEK